MRTPRIVPVFLALAIASATYASEPEDSRLDSVGGVRIGQKFNELKSEVQWQSDGDSDLNDETGCGYFTSDLLPKSMWMMVDGGVIVRFDAGKETPSLPYGVGIGESESTALRKLPGDTIVEPSYYEGDIGGHYLTWRDKAKDLAIRVETSDGKVAAMYWGRWSQVQYVEGCL